MNATLTLLAKHLVTIPSTSSNESRVMAYVAEWAKKQGLPVFMQRKHGLVNLACVSGSGKPTTVLTTHLDTVEPDPKLWKKTKPYSPRIIGDKLYGLGASDAKGIAAAMLWAALSFQKSAEAWKGKVVVVLVSDEERTGKGSEVVIPFVKQHPSLRIIPKSTAVIVGEPTNLMEIGLGNRGNVFISLTVHGKSVHSSRPKDGKNAASKAASIIVAIPDFVDQLNNKHPDLILKGTNITVTSMSSNLGIVAGIIVPTKLNTLPEKATFTLDCRLSQPYFQNNFRLFWKEFDKFIANQREAGFRLTWEKIHPEVAGHAIKQSSPLVQLLARSIFGETGKKASYRVALGANDAPFWAKAGFEVVNEYGLGNNEVIHQPDEWVSLSELEKGALVYLSFAKMWINKTLKI